MIKRVGSRRCEYEVNVLLPFGGLFGGLLFLLRELNALIIGFLRMTVTAHDLIIIINSCFNVLFDNERLLFVEFDKP